MTKRTPLFFVCLALLLLSFGTASHALERSGERSFMDICESGTPEEIEWALANGASVFDRDEENFTPLMAASIANSAEAVSVLLKAGAEVNTPDIAGLTPLIYAAGNNLDSRVCQALVEAGANVNQPDDDGFTPLMYAAINNKNPRVVETLIKAGSLLSLRNEDGRTALDLAIAYENFPAIQILKEHHKSKTSPHHQPVHRQPVKQ